MSELNENHQRKLLATCQYVDDLLTESVWRMMPEFPASPLRSYISDATPDQIGILRKQLGRLRQAMAEILRENGIIIPSPQISALWAFRTALMEAGEVVFDLQTRFMSSYGPLTPEAKQRLDEMAARLTQQIELFTRAFNDLAAENPRAEQNETEAP